MAPIDGRCVWTACYPDETGNDSQASAEVNTPSLPFSRSADSPDHASTTGDYRVPQPFSATESAMAGVRGKFYQTAGSIKDAVTLHPKVIAAKDPTSLDFDPGPLHPDLYVSAAAVLEQQHRTAEAAGKYQQALELDPHHRSALIGSRACGIVKATRPGPFRSIRTRCRPTPTTRCC